MIYSVNVQWIDFTLTGLLSEPEELRSNLQKSFESIGKHLSQDFAPHLPKVSYDLHKGKRHMAEGRGSRREEATCSLSSGIGREPYHQ
jgi:hypothetical protein